MVVYPFTKDGILMIDLYLNEVHGKLHQIAPVELFNKGEVRYDTKNMGFMSSQSVKEGQSEYDDSLIVKLEL
jgi:hypothetical protein